MPGRRILLATDQFYHVYNKTIDDRLVFTGKKELDRAKLTLLYYKFISPSIRLSYFLSKSRQDRKQIIEDLIKKSKLLVDVISYCFMPNHYHFLLKQKTDNGISKYMSQFQNSFTRYFNVRHERKGPLFFDQFKAKRIETDEQLLHVSRYIHLNPFTSYLLKDLKSLEEDERTSFPEYIDRIQKICNVKIILDFFKNKDKYKKFVYNQADYQRQLAKIEYLTFETLD